MTTTLVLPWPPSVNNATAVVRGRKILSARGRQYRANAHAAILEQNPPRFGEKRVRVLLTLEAPDKRRRDISNFEKAVVDALVFARVLDDDEQIDEITLVRGVPKKPGRAVITLQEIKQGTP